MNLIEAIKETRPVKEWSRDELLSALRAFRLAKCWTGKYFEVNREVQRRASAANNQLFSDNQDYTEWQ